MIPLKQVVSRGIGASSILLRSSATFELPKEIVVERVHKVLVPKTMISEMKNQ